jgi:hypothetical protein
MQLSVSSKNGVKLYNNLMNIEGGGYSSAHKIKHPADIFRVSIEKLDSALDDLLLMIGSHDFDPYKEKAICNYILELDSFYDRMLLIMKGLTPPVQEDNKDAAKWLKSNNPIQYNQFKDATTKSHGTIRKAANRIKHDTLTVEYLTVTNHKNYEVKGFYFANIVGGDELIGPDPDIHDSYKGSPTAFSNDYFIRYTAGFVASCIFHLNNIFFKGVKNKPTKLDVVHSYFSKKQTSGLLLFPNEYYSSVASLKGSGNSIVIKYPFSEKRDGNTDKITAVQPLFKINQRTRVAHNQWPYFKLLS